MRRVQLVVPQHTKTEVVGAITANPFCYSLQEFNQDDGVHIAFRIPPKHLQSIIVQLSSIGCGDSYGTIDVTTTVLSRPLPPARQALEGGKKRLYRINDRMTIDEIEDIIEDGNHLTFDYMALMLCSSVIAGGGLIGDSNASVIASMLVSPLMGPILSMTYGLAVVKTDIVARGMRNEIVGILITFFVGFVMGLCAVHIYGSGYRSSEMISRGKMSGLLVGLVIAAPSAVAVVLAVSKGGFNAIVGTAISVSLLPPVVNCGICMGFCIVIYAENGDTHDASVFLNTGLMSFALWFSNFLIIIMFGFGTFRYIKNVHPFHTTTSGLSCPEKETPTFNFMRNLDSSVTYGEENIDFSNIEAQNSASDLEPKSNASEKKPKASDGNGLTDELLSVELQSNMRMSSSLGNSDL